VLSRPWILLAVSLVAPGCFSEAQTKTGSAEAATGASVGSDDAGATEAEGGGTTAGGASGATDGSSTVTGTDGSSAGVDSDAESSEGTTGTTSEGGSSGETGDPIGPDCDEIDCTGDVVWSRSYGNGAPPVSSENVSTLATDPAGNTVIAGHVQGVADFGDLGTVEGDGAGFVARVGPDGEPLWVHGLYAAYNLEPRASAVDDSGNSVIVGAVRGNLTVQGQTFEGNGNWNTFVLRFEADGSLGSGHVFDYSDEPNSAHAVAIDESGRVAVGGEFRGGISFGGTHMSAQGVGPDMFVAVFDPSLTHLWSRRFGDDETQATYGVGFTEGGDVVVSGRNWGTVEFGGNASHTTTGLSSMVVARLEADDGEEVWSQQYDLLPGAIATFPRLLATPDAIYLGTYSASADDIEVDFGLGPSEGFFHLVRLDPDGNAQWDRSMTGLRGVHEMARDTGDGLLVVGTLSGTVDFGNGPLSSASSDGFLAKYNAHTGELNWARLISDDNQQSNLQYGLGVGTDASGHVYVGGSFYGVIDFGDGDLVSGGGFGGADGFLAKLMP